MTLTQPQARELVRTSLLRVVPDGDFAAVGDATTSVTRWRWTRWTS